MLFSSLEGKPHKKTTTKDACNSEICFGNIGHSVRLTRINKEPRDFPAE